MTRVDPAWLLACLEPVANGHGAALVASTWEGGVRLEITRGPARASLRLHARTDGPAWARTPSLSWFRDDREPSLDPVLADLVAAARARDDGAWELVKGAQLPEDAVAVPVHETPKDGPVEDALMDWLAAADGLPATLARHAHLAWWAHRRDEPYPFAALGGPDDPMGAWLLARWPEGFSREAFVAAHGDEAGEALMDRLATLRALGVVEVDDAGVHVAAGEGADPAIWAVFAWHPAVRDAVAVAAGAPMSDARASLERELGGG